MNDEQKIMLADMIIALRKQLATASPIVVQYEIVSDSVRVWTRSDPPKGFAEIIALLIGGSVKSSGC